MKIFTFQTIPKITIKNSWWHKNICRYLEQVNPLKYLKISSLFLTKMEAFIAWRLRCWKTILASVLLFVIMFDWFIFSFWKENKNIFLNFEANHFNFCVIPSNRIYLFLFFAKAKSISLQKCSLRNSSLQLSSAPMKRTKNLHALRGFTEGNSVLILRRRLNNLS